MEKEKFSSYNFLRKYYSKILKTAFQVSVGMGYILHATFLSEDMGHTKLGFKDNACLVLLKWQKTFDQ